MAKRFLFNAFLLTGIALLAAPLSTATAEESMTPDAWYKEVAPVLSTTYCNAMGDIFVTPFSVTADECQSLITQTTELCFQAHKVNMPPKITSVDESKKWGQTLGQCIGASYKILMQARPK